LYFCLDHRWLVTLCMMGLLALAFVGYPHMRQGFFPDMVYNQCYMEYKLPEGTNSTRVKRDLDSIEHWRQRGYLQ
jgi:multidrug efflux pump subunit AcrB